MAKKYELKDRTTNEVVYPITKDECVLDSSGNSIKTTIVNLHKEFETYAEFSNTPIPNNCIAFIKESGEVYYNGKRYVKSNISSENVIIDSITKLSDVFYRNSDALHIGLKVVIGGEDDSFSEAFDIIYLDGLVFNKEALIALLHNQVLSTEEIVADEALHISAGNGVPLVDNKIYLDSPIVLTEGIDESKSKIRLIPDGGKKGEVISLDNQGRLQWMNLLSDYEDIFTYGVEFDTTVADPHLTRIGNMSLHKTLPIQSSLKGCIALKDLIIYWLNEKDWRFRKDPIYKTVDLSNDVEFPQFCLGCTTDLGVGQYIKAGSHIGKIAYIEGTSINVEWEEDLGDISAELTTITLVEIGSRLDGYHGTVKIHCNEFWIKSTLNGTKCQVRISPRYIDDTYTYQPECLIDAYRCTVLRTVPTNMGYLSSLPANSAISVVNTSDYCRGGSNRSVYDQYLADGTLSGKLKTDLGKPATYMPRPTMRDCCRKAGTYMLSYEEYKNIFYWLYVIEYANFNCQEDYNEQLTAEGYHQGGMGAGVTTLTGEYWSNFNSWHPIVPCGYVNELGNGTGTKLMILPTFEVTSAETTSFAAYSKVSGLEYSITDGVLNVTSIPNSNPFVYASRLVQSGSTTYKIEGLLEGQSIIFKKNNIVIGTAATNDNITIDWGNLAEQRSIVASFTGNCNLTLTIVSATATKCMMIGYNILVPRWRGFDNPFGDTWTNVDGIIINANEHSDKNYIYICKDPSKFADTLTSDYIKVSKGPFSNGWIKTFDLLNEAHIFPASVGASPTTYISDFTHYGSKNSILRTVLFGGYASHGSSSGLGSFASDYGVSGSTANVGFRSAFGFGRLP